MLSLDHIVISSESLAIGQAFIENKLGIRADTGGEHKLFGTHNKLISLGDTYLEVIAVSPDLIPETTPRWFNLDHFNGPPTITNWVCGTNFGEFAPSNLMNGMGDILNLSRGSLKWKITVPKDGKLPYEGAVPALIDWGESKHPTDTLKESGCRMTKFRIKHKYCSNLQSKPTRFYTLNNEDQ